ncbi:hypothetical protein IAR55_002252 [Kwoniella newhampshirensis]|uniref:G-protein coupled receptors family 1 profile domain-containing protein n=1 Tax=Kwoniella newhampshirensis TaxID=1651941 RepID=A0AAW0Z0Z2_9TREE
MSVTATVTATGGAVVSGLTLIAAIYLLISLWRQGRGKLRVRLLVGMVISDILLGVVVFPTEISFLAGNRLQLDSRGCNAQGFLLITILFTQHMWTLAIAIATFCLLRYPLSRLTVMLEMYSWLIGPFIWAVSLIHSGLWYGLVGFSTTGALCYYGTKSVGLDRDLVQFVPRALVFAVIVILYTRLFKFLRRPDTIHLSTGFATDPGAGEQVSHIPAAPTPKVFRPLARFGRLGSSAGNKEAVNVDAPWEALEFVQVGYHHDLNLPTPSETGQFELAPYAPKSILHPSRPVSPDIVSPGTIEVKDPILRVRTASGSSITTSSGPSSQRPSATDTLVTPELAYNYELPPSADSTTKLVSPESQPPLRAHILSPVLSQGSHNELELGPEMDIVDADGDDRGRYSRSSSEDRRPSGQTLKEFFQEYQVPGPDEGRVPTGGRGSGSNEHKPPQLSAAAYFNRQASLLMLYFPLAYMAVFSVSLVRLIYDMVHRMPSPVLGIISNWLVLSVGLIDGLVYGLAELMVRRKVRRKMPEHIYS